MHVLDAIGEDEMIAIFLRAEVDSPRYGKKLRALLVRDGREVEVLRRPDPSVADDNRYRRGLLEEHRGYESREALFDGFPQRVDWFRATLAATEVLEIRYIVEGHARLTACLRALPRVSARRARDRARRLRRGRRVVPALITPGST